MNILSHSFFKNFMLIVSCLACCLSLSSPLLANASEVSIYSEASYDLTKGGTQDFIISNKNGELLYVTITELPNQTRISNGTYKATITKSGYWSAGFNVTISNNCITSVGNKFITVFSGTVLSNNLNLESAKQASLYMSYRNNLIVYSTGVRAKISGTSLNVSEI